MSSTTITIKRHNHRVHPCDRNQKLALLKHLIALHSDKEIVIIAARDISELELELDADNISLKSDKELIENTKVQCDMIISLDLAQSPESYIKRLNQTNTYALLLADDQEQQELYKIETLMKRTLTKEFVSGFEPRSHRQAEAEAKGLKVRQALNTDKQAQRDDKRARQQNGPSSKKREESKYLGKDENGKPIFSGKSRERNHRHDGTPKNESEKQNTPKPRDNAQSGERKPWDKTAGDKKPWDKPAGDKKPWDKTSGDKKPGDKKPWDKPAGAKKPWDKKESTGTAGKSAPKRSGRIIRIPTAKK
ncbi:MAG: hypothetical protein MUP09_12575 [Thiovulaceae bacterium]|nr:hypothetical protein [Sulfurimonadaceae bacterium]